MEKQEWPTTKEEAVKRLIAVMPDTAKETVRKMSDDDLYSLHFTVGMWIRNNFGLWEGNEALWIECGYKDQPPHEAADGSSHVILMALRDELAQEK